MQHDVRGSDVVLRCACLVGRIAPTVRPPTHVAVCTEHSPHLTRGGSDDCEHTLA